MVMKIQKNFESPPNAWQVVRWALMRKQNKTWDLESKILALTWQL